MTKQEAMELETKCDDLISEALDGDYVVSMALTGMLKVKERDGNDFITFNITSDTACPKYINFNGFYDDVRYWVGNIIECIEENSETFNKLLWSYEHIRELT